MTCRLLLLVVVSGVLFVVVCWLSQVVAWCSVFVCCSVLFDVVVCFRCVLSDACWLLYGVGW